MAIVEAINIPIGVTGTETVEKAANSYEDLGDAVAKTQLEAERLAQQFGINDAKTQEAIKVAGKYKQQMEELDFAIEGARGGVDQLFRASQGVVAGFEVAAGAAALFGNESEELQKILMRVQGAMALSQGLKDFKEFLPAIKNVASNITGPLTKSIQGFGKAARTAIAATGIGLLVVAVASLVSYWEDIMELLNGVSGKQKDLLESQQKTTEATKEQLDNISATENILKQQGKTEGEILQMKIKAAQANISSLEAQLKTQQEIKRVQIETATRNRDILAGILKFISEPITKILEGVDALVNAFGGNSNLAKGFLGGIESAASLIFDPEAIAEEGDKSIKETEKQLTAMKNQLAGFQNTQTANYRKSIEDRKKADDEEFNQWLDNELKKYETDQNNAEFLKKREQQDAEDEEEMFNAWLEAELERNEVAAQNAEYVAKRKADAAQQEADAKKAVADLEQELFNQSQALANAIINIAGEQSKIGKALALAQIGADTAKALTAALANSQAPTADNVATGGLAGIAKYITLATTILSNSKRAYDILKAPAPSGSVSRGNAAASVPTFQAPRTGFNIQGEQFTQATRVYVTEADISNTQNKVKVTEGISSF